MIHYIIARRDYGEHIIRYWNRTSIGIGTATGVTAAQVTHAAGESFAQWMECWTRLDRLARPKPTFRAVPTGTTAIVLGVPNERALKALERKLRDNCINHVAVREPDAPWNGQLMTIGLWPDAPAVRLLRRYKLL